MTINKISDAEPTQQIQILQTTLDNIGAYVYAKDIHGRYTFANQLVCDLFGTTLDKIIGADDSQFFSLEASNDLRENDIRVLTKGETIQNEERNVIAQTGEIKYYLTVKTPLFDEQGKIIGMSGVSTDITDIKKAEFRYLIQSEVMTQIIAKLPLQTILTTLSNSIEKFNPNSLCSILLVDNTGKRLINGASPNLPTFYNEAINGVTIADKTGSCSTAAFRQQRVIVEDIATHPYWQDYAQLASKAELASCWSEPIIAKNGETLGSFAIYHKEPCSPTQEDFSTIEFAAQLATIAIEQHRSLKRQKLYQQIYDSSHEGIIIFDPQGMITNVNQAFTDITTYTEQDVIGQNLKTIVSEPDNPEAAKSLWQQITTQPYWQSEFWGYKKTGERYLQSLHITQLYDEEKQLLNYVGILTDITEQKQYQDALELMAHYDVLTKLPNRALFEDRFNQAVAQSKRSGKELAICFIDLDDFKPINDNFGHKAGDELLIEIAKRFTEAIREQDTLSRQGGDEFVLLLGNLGPGECYENIIRRLYDSIKLPFIIDNYAHKITVSTGIAIYPQDGDDSDTLLRHADQAMYLAKVGGKHRFNFYSRPKQRNN